MFLHGGAGNKPRANHRVSLRAGSEEVRTDMDPVTTDDQTPESEGRSATFLIGAAIGAAQGALTWAAAGTGGASGVAATGSRIAISSVLRGTAAGLRQLTRLTGLAPVTTTALATAFTDVDDGIRWADHYITGGFNNLIADSAINTLTYAGSLSGLYQTESAGTLAADALRSFAPTAAFVDGPGAVVAHFRDGPREHSALQGAASTGAAMTARGRGAGAAVVGAVASRSRRVAQRAAAPRAAPPKPVARRPGRVGRIARGGLRATARGIMALGNLAASASSAVLDSPAPTAAIVGAKPITERSPHSRYRMLQNLHNEAYQRHQQHRTPARTRGRRIRTHEPASPSL